MKHILLSAFCMLIIFSGAYAMEEVSEDGPPPPILPATATQPSLKTKVIKHTLWLSLNTIAIAGLYYGFPQSGSNWHRFRGGCIDPSGPFTPPVYTCETIPEGEDFNNGLLFCFSSLLFSITGTGYFVYW